MVLVWTAKQVWNTTGDKIKLRKSGTIPLLNFRSSVRVLGNCASSSVHVLSSSAQFANSAAQLSSRTPTRTFVAENGPQIPFSNSVLSLPTVTDLIVWRYCTQSHGVAMQ